jgi:hypothetical protein
VFYFYFSRDSLTDRLLIDFNHSSISSYLCYPFSLAYFFLRVSFFTQFDSFFSSSLRFIAICFIMSFDRELCLYASGVPTDAGREEIAGYIAAAGPGCLLR